MASKANKITSSTQTLASYLKDSRNKSGKTQAEVAEYMNYGTNQFISNWERGISNPPVADLRKICKFIGADAITAFELLEGEALNSLKARLSREFSAGR